MRANETITPPAAGTAPPHSPVPAPRATIGSPSSRAIFTTAQTSRVDSRQHDRRRHSGLGVGVERVHGEIFGRRLHRAGSERFDQSLAQHVAPQRARAGLTVTPKSSLEN